jgi:hypothetical protein
MTALCQLEIAALVPFKRNSHFGLRISLDWLVGLKLRSAVLAHAKGYRRELYDLENAFWHSLPLSPKFYSSLRAGSV